MASRSRQKTLARERRLEQERAAVVAAGRRRRLQLLVGTVVVALVLVGVGIAISASGHSYGLGGLVTGGASTRLTAQVDAELHGIPEHGTTLGDPHAKAKLTRPRQARLPLDVHRDLQTTSARPCSTSSRPPPTRRACRTGSGTTTSSSTASRAPRARPM
jgi:hypothetical protein